jgi:hypothetical protein
MVAVQAMLYFCDRRIIFRGAGGWPGSIPKGRLSGKRRSWGDRPAKGDIRGGIGINPCFGHLLGSRATAG